MRIWKLLAVLVVALCALGIVKTHRVFSPTFDEPFHLAVGMQVLDRGTYQYEWLHPPMARLAAGLGPWLAGGESHGNKLAHTDGLAILHDGDYWTNLSLARLGTLPFWFLSCLMVYLWGKRWFSQSTALWALLLFAVLPAVLGHAGLATQDVAAFASLLVALYFLVAWFENPGWGESVGLAAGMALSFLCKFSNIGFFVVCAMASLVLLRPRLQWKRGLAVAGLIFFLIWAGYGFSLLPMASRLKPESSLYQALGKTWMTVPLPLVEFVLGLKELAAYTQDGHDAFFLGEYRRDGWWYFFPVILGIKTPIGFLFLSLAGIALLIWQWRQRPWQQRLVVLVPLVILSLCAFSKINLGIRHILAVFPFLALVAGEVVVLSMRRRWLGSGAIVLAALCCIESALAYPDWMAYFNPLAGKQPEQIVVDSDLDWGQDLARLSARLKELGVKELSIEYFGGGALSGAGLPPYRILQADEKVRGWVAISIHSLNTEFARRFSYTWLHQHKPLETVGRSIYLYWID